jgi:hypothetical protein
MYCSTGNLNWRLTVLPLSETLLKLEPATRSPVYPSAFRAFSQGLIRVAAPGIGFSGRSRTMRASREADMRRIPAPRAKD